MFAGQAPLEALLDQPLARAEHGCLAGIQGFHDAAVTPALTRLGNVGLEQDPCLEHPSGGMLALADQRFERLSLLQAQPDDVFFDRHFRHVPIPGNVECRCQRVTEPRRNQGRETLVPRVAHIAGYSRFSFTRASAVVNCQSALACFLLRLSSQAATSSVRVCLSGMRRSRHWPDNTLSSDSAMFSQLPCLGV